MIHRNLIFLVIVVLGIISLYSCMAVAEQENDAFKYVGSWNLKYDSLWPCSIAVADPFIYVVDNSNAHYDKKSHRIWAFDFYDRDPIFTWGSYGMGEDAKDGQFAAPYGIAVDFPNHRVLVADTYNNRIQKFNMEGRFIAKWGSKGGGDGQFNLPMGVTVGPDNCVYVSDSGNNRIQKFDSEGRFIAKWGSGGTGDGEFNNPRDIEVDPSGYVYVADFGNHRIQKFDGSGKFITKWGSRGDGDGLFSYPTGVGIDTSGHIYVADYQNCRIQIFDSNGKFIQKFGERGPGNNQFSGPEDVEVLEWIYPHKTQIYVTDYFNNRVQVFERTSQSPVPLIADFRALPASGSAPLKVIFTDISTGNPQFWNYNFGDGRSDTSKNPDHTFTAAGSYTVTLTVMKLVDGQMVRGSAEKQITVTGGEGPVQDLKAVFIANPAAGVAPLEVKFTDTSTGSPLFWNYNFGDGRSNTSKNPVHTFTAAGSYTVTLTVMKLVDGQMMRSTAEKQIVVTGGEGPVQDLKAGFTAGPLSGNAPLKVTFTDTSTGNPQFWNYTFGDGRSDSSKNPVHTYLSPGNYTVTLTVMKADRGTLVKNTTTSNGLINVI